jgi:hypothetical protein
MKTRDELIETMARAIDPMAWSDIGLVDHDERKRSLWEAIAALRALEAAGLVVVPREETERQRGFNAARTMVESIDIIHTDWGPSATPNDGLEFGLKTARDVFKTREERIAEGATYIRG